jgi:hypothetical protein
MKFINKVFGQPVKILVGHMSVVMCQSPGYEKLGKRKYITKVDNADDLDLEETRGIGCTDREEEIINGGKNPPAEEECALLVMQLDKLGILGYCSPIILLFCHGSYSFLGKV